jgi:enterochelin esterase-like enzyme
VASPSGSGGALRTGPLELDVAKLPTSFPALNRSANERLRLLRITCGTADGLIGVNRQFRQYLEAQGVSVTYAETPDVGHVWPFWRQSLADFLPSLFK